MKDERKAYIYGLFDPRTSNCFYVGLTIDYENRMKCYFVWNRNVNADAARIISDIRKDGLQPISKILEECAYSGRRNREAFWVLKMHESGNSLVNIAMFTSGGKPRMGLSEYANGKKPVPLCCYVPQSIVDVIDSIAAESREPRSGVVRRLIESALQNANRPSA